MTSRPHSMGPPAGTRITVVGIGAVGGTVAAALGDAGQTPVLAARTPVGRITRRLADEETTFDFPCVTEPKASASTDWVLLCTKAYQVDGASLWLEHLVNQNTRVAVLQNGVDHVERLSHLVPATRILPVVVYMACERERPDYFSQVRAGRLHVPDSPDGREFADLFAGSPAIEAIAEPDFPSLLWRKLTINAATGGICALSLNPNCILTDPAMSENARALMREVMVVGQAEGATFPDRFVDDTLEMLAGPVGAHWTSMAQDRKAGRRMEWEVRNAVVGKIARRHRIPTPLNDLVAALLAVAT